MGVCEFNRWFLWTPVFIALGNITYFNLEYEPSLLKTLLFSSFIVPILIFIKKEIKNKILHDKNISFSYSILMTTLLSINLFIAFILGIASSKIRTYYLQTFQFLQNFESVSFQGHVFDVEDVPRGTLKKQRILRRCILNHLQNFPIPLNPSIRIRIQGPYKKLKNIKPGDYISLQSSLFSPPYPLTLHGYNAPFDAYFKKISAFGKVQAILSINSYSFNEVHLIERVSSWIQKKRGNLSNTLRQKLSIFSAPLATALITGDKSGITFQVRENFIRSGLSHMLAISGLHMGLLSWFIFCIFSRFLVLIPHLATKFVVKKIAAILTIPIAFCYLLLSGVSFSALRAFIMVTLSMMAILIDQKPISLRCTAIAACIILILFPESIYSVSFQLSFASVAGLCYAYESRMPFWIQKILWGQYPQKNFSKKDKFLKIFQKWCLRPLTQSVFSTLIATFMTTPLVIYVFQRMTGVGILGNLLAIPVLSFCVIPLGLLSILSLFIFPEGSSVLFSLWERSLTVLSEIASYVATLPGANYIFPKPSLMSLIFIMISALWLMIWQERKRWLGLLPFLWGVSTFFYPQPPDIFIAQKGKIIGIRDSHQFLISNQRFGSFHAKVWAQECGLQDVRPLPYAEIQQWRAQLDDWIPKALYDDDVVFLWKNNENNEFRQKTTPFHQKKRPWYGPSLPAQGP